MKLRRLIDAAGQGYLYTVEYIELVGRGKLDKKVIREHAGDINMRVEAYDMQHEMLVGNSWEHISKQEFEEFIINHKKKDVIIRRKVS